MLATLLCQCPHDVWAYLDGKWQDPESKIVYEYHEYADAGLNFAEIVDGKEATGDLVIPGAITIEGISFPVTAIRNYAFVYCFLTSLSIPESIQSISDNSFWNCRGLERIAVEKGNVSYDSRDNCNALIVTGRNELILGCRNTEIPRSVARIGEKAFQNCTDLTSITIHEGITFIGEQAFIGCNADEIIVEEGNKVYDSRGNCHAIIETATNRLLKGSNHAVIPPTVTEIASGAFSGCSRISSVIIPASVKRIVSAAFNCENLTTVTCLAEVPPISTLAFKVSKDGKDTFGPQTLKVPYGTKDIYSKSFDWKDFPTIVELPQFAHGAWQDPVTKMKYEYEEYPSIYEGGIVRYTATVTDGEEAEGDLVIPEYITVDGTSFPVKAIGSRVFAGNTRLTSLTLPRSLEEIGADAFSGCSENLERIAVEEGNIFYDSRDNCNALIATGRNELVLGCRNTEIPRSVTRIGAEAFLNCTDLTSITIHEGITFIGEQAFDGCNTDEIIVEEGNKVYDSRGNCHAIVETATNRLLKGSNHGTIPPTVTEIAAGAFRKCSGITSIILPRFVKHVGGGAFVGCKDLTTVTCLAKVPPMAHLAFSAYIDGKRHFDLQTLYVPYGTKKLYSATNEWFEFPDIVELPDYSLGTWKDPDARVEYEYSESPSPYDEGAFIYFADVIEGKEAAGDLVIPGYVTIEGKDYTVETVGEGAFAGNTRLTALTLPKGLMDIGAGAFTGCSESLERIAVEEGNIFYDSRDNCNALIATGRNELVLGCRNTEIPRSVARIGEKAFLNCKDLASITIHEGITFIGEQAFAGCNTDEIIVEGGNNVYDSRGNCHAIIRTANNTLLKGSGRTVIPGTVTEIAAGAFMGCSGITSVTIPSSVRKIGRAAFQDCKSLATVTCLARSAPSTDMSFDVSRGEGQPAGFQTLHVPYNSLQSYAAAKEWSLFPHITEDYGLAHGIWKSPETKMRYEYTEAGSTIDYNNRFYTAVIIDAQEASGNLVIPESIAIEGNRYNVNTIGDGAFAGNTRLTSLTLPRSVVSITPGAFAGCSESLERIAVEEGNNFYDSRDNCNALIATGRNELVLGCRNTIIPRSVTRIGAEAFLNCKPLRHVSIHKGIADIGYMAFAGCDTYEIIVEEGNKVYDSRDKCHAIIETATSRLLKGSNQTVIPNTVTEIAHGAFKGCSGIASITIPPYVKRIRDEAFVDCENLTAMTCLAKEPPLSSFAFVSYKDGKQYFSLQTLYVPYGTKELYSTWGEWRLFPNIIELSEEETIALSIRNNNKEVTPASIVYDLSGCRIQGEPQRKGVYIRGGRKYVRP